MVHKAFVVWPFTRKKEMASPGLESCTILDGEKGENRSAFALEGPS